MTGRDPMVSPVVGDIIVASGSEYRVVSVDRTGRLVSVSVDGGEATTWYLGEWMALALRCGRVGARGGVQ